MNFYFNKKLLLFLLLYQISLNNTVYSTTDTVLSVDGNFNINSTGSADATRLMVYKTGVATLGDDINLDDNKKSVFYLWNETNNFNQDVSEIRNTMYINKNGDFLNESKLYIRKNIGDNKEDNANKSGDAILRTNGLFINQAEMILGSGATLICGKFPGNDNTSWGNLLDYKLRNGILNGFSWNTSNENIVRYYKYNNTNGYSIDEYRSTNVSEAKNGTIAIIPGAIINDGDGSYGEIDGGIIDMVKYIGLFNNDIIYTNDEGKDPDINTNCAVATDTGRKLQVHFKNATINLFTNKELKKALIINTVRDDNSIDNDDSITEKYKVKEMFSNLIFTNCTSKIPDDLEGLYKSNNMEIPFSTPDGLTTEQNDAHLYKYCRTADDITSSSNLHELILDSDGNNFKQVKLLFSSSPEIQDKIYHNKIDNNNGLNLINSVSGSKKGFSELFNLYMNYNCYIPLDKTKLGFLISDSLDDLTQLRIKFENGLNPTLNDIHKRTLYIQLDGDINLLIANKYIYKSQMEGGGFENKDGNFTQALYLYFENPWKNYSGNIKRALPELDDNFTIDTIRQEYISNYGLYDDGDDEEDVNNKIITKLITKDNDEYLTNLEDEVNMNSDQENYYYNIYGNKIEAFKYLLQVKSGSNETITQEELLKYLLNLYLQEVNDKTDSNNYQKRITELFQDYDGPAFNRYELKFSSNDETKEYKNDCKESEILKYTVGSNNRPIHNMTNFSANGGDETKPFVVDKFSVGDVDNSTPLTVDSNNTEKTNILTQEFVVQVNTKYTMNGFINVTKLKKSDFNKE